MSYMEIYKDEVYDLLVDRENARPVVHLSRNKLTLSVGTETPRQRKPARKGVRCEPGLPPG